MVLKTSIYYILIQFWFVLLQKLLSAILSHRYVPIPLQRRSSDINNYRGITLRGSSAIAKLFEMCILNLYQDFLITSDLQFGFKKSVGCRGVCFHLCYLLFISMILLVN